MNSLRAMNKQELKFSEDAHAKRNLVTSKKTDLRVAISNLKNEILR